VRGGGKVQGEGDDERRLLDMIFRAEATRGRGARAEQHSARVHGWSGRRSPRGLDVSTCPSQPYRVKAIGHTAYEVKGERNKHSGPWIDHSLQNWSGTGRCLELGGGDSSGD
jgi:hypothetical protein